MNKLLYLVSAAVGAAVGAAAAYYICRSKIEEAANEEIEQVKRVYRKKYEGCAEAETEIYEPKADEDILPVIKKYSSDATEPKAIKPPYSISPNEFGDEEDYECITLQYYKDEVLADDSDEIIDNWEEVAGSDFYKHFGDYDDGVVYIRNDKFKCYYEICESELYYDATNEQSSGRSRADD